MEFNEEEFWRIGSQVFLEVIKFCFTLFSILTFICGYVTMRLICPLDTNKDSIKIFLSFAKGQKTQKNANVNIDLAFDLQDI